MNSSPQEDSGGNELVVLPGGRLSDREAQIEGGLEANIQASVQQLIESHEHDPPNKMSPEEEARLWAELKTDTGYSSYSAYLRACKEIHLYSKDVDESLWKAAADEHRSLDSSRLPACAVFDLSKGDNSRPELTLHCSSSSGSVILAALHQPLVGKAVRIVLWETSELNTDLVDALGLGLKIHQRFFHVLLPTSASWSHFHVDPDRIKKRPLVPDVVVLENYVVTMAHSNLPVYSDATPVVLIAGKKFGAMSSEAQIDAMLRFRSVTVKNVSESLDKIPAWTKEYVRILQYDLEKGRRSIESDMDLSFRPLAPLQYLHIFTIRRHCSEVREKYKKFIDPSNVLAKRTSLEDLYEMRVGLRRMVEDSEDNSEQLRRFMRSQQTLDVRQERSFITIEDDLKQSRLEARRLETEIRDCLQLQTGELALQESRKSIELSNLQIEEGKRVKIFTILAFVYVPLNLATSIFGMNLEQLNGSGQHLWVFLTTAVITLAVTGGSWFAIEQMNSYLKWRKRSPDEPYDGKTQFTLAVRLALFVYLVSNGHTSWMFKSGVWWRILTNHNSRLVSSYLSHEDNGRLNAGEHVSKYSIKAGTGALFGGASHLYGVRWTSDEEEEEET